MKKDKYPVGTRFIDKMNGNHGTITRKHPDYGMIYVQWDSNVKDFEIDIERFDRIHIIRNDRHDIIYPWVKETPLYKAIYGED